MGFKKYLKCGLIRPQMWTFFHSAAASDEFCIRDTLAVFLGVGDLLLEPQLPFVAAAQLKCVYWHSFSKLPLCPWSNILPRFIVLQCCDAWGTKSHQHSVMVFIFAPYMQRFLSNSLELVMDITGFGRWISLKCFMSGPGHQMMFFMIFVVVIRLQMAVQYHCSLLSQLMGVWSK